MFVYKLSHLTVVKLYLSTIKYNLTRCTKKELLIKTRLVLDNSLRSHCANLETSFCDNSEGSELSSIVTQYMYIIHNSSFGKTSNYRNECLDIVDVFFCFLTLPHFAQNIIVFYLYAYKIVLYMHAYKIKVYLPL